MAMARSILVVDDEASVRGLVRTLLQRDGFEVGEAASAREALELLRRSQFDVVLADVVMPGTDGVKLLEEVRKLDACLPVVLMTGYGTIDTAVDAMRRGAADYIPKPFKRTRLLHSLGQALAGRKSSPATPERPRPEKGTREPVEGALLDSAFEQHMTLRELGDRYIERTLWLLRGNKVQAARALGVNRRTLYRRGPSTREPDQ